MAILSDFVKGLRRERRVELARGIGNPVAVAQKRRDTCETAAAFLLAGGGRPAHHADHQWPFAVISGCTGIARAAAKPDALVARRRVVEADLQRARLSGHCEGRHARLAEA